MQLQTFASDGSLRGHIWSSPAFSAATQKAAITTVTPIFYSDQILDAIKSIRANNRLVVDGMRGVGRRLSEMRENIARVHDRGAAVMDAQTSRLSTSAHCDAMIDEALRAIANESRGPRKHTGKSRRMPWDMAQVHYFNTLLTNEQLEAIVAIGYAPMSYHTMWRHFKKPRGAPVGRPSAARLAAQI